MAHVEELRQIHADINAMETIIKQAEESRRTLQVKADKHTRQSRIFQSKLGKYV